MDYAELDDKLDFEETDEELIDDTDEIPEEEKELNDTEESIEALSEIEEDSEPTDELNDWLDGLSEEELNEDIEILKRDTPTFSDNWKDADLFEERREGIYEYDEDDLGKTANGTLDISDDGKRNLYNQRTVGGDDRRDTDDGGHLIGYRFRGSSDFENLVPQDSNFNRGAYKELENHWEQLIRDGNKVYVNIETYNGEGTSRPNAFMGYYIVESPEGKRSWEAFSFPNESQKRLEEIYGE